MHRPPAIAAVLALGLLLTAPAARADEGDDRAAFLRAFRAKDAPAMAEIARRQAVPWPFADDLLGLGEGPAAEAFAAALPEETGRPLGRYLASRRGAAESASARAALRAAAEEAGARRWQAVLDVLGAPGAEPELGTVLAARMDGYRGNAHKARNEVATAAAAYGRAGATARLLGWSSMAVDALRLAKNLAYDASLCADALRHAQRLRDVLEGQRDAAAVADLDHDEGAILKELGDVGAAADRFRQALQAYEALGARHKAATTRSDLAACLATTGDFAAARALFRRVEREYDELARAGERVEPWEYAENRCREGVLYDLMDEEERARSLLERALADARAGKDRWGEGIVLGNLAVLDLSRGRWAPAIARLDLACGIFEEVGDRRSLAGGLVDLAHARIDGARGGLRLVAGRKDEASAADRASALRSLEEARIRVAAALRIQTQLGFEVPAALSHGAFGEILMAQDRPQEALAEFEAARQACARLRAWPHMAELSSWVAKARFALAQWPEAVRDARRAVEDDERLTAPPVEEIRARELFEMPDTFDVGAMAARRLAEARTGADRAAAVEDVGYFLEAGLATDLARAVGGRSVVQRAAVPGDLLATAEAAGDAKAKAFADYSRAHAEGSRDAAALWPRYQALRKAESDAIWSVQVAQDAAQDRVDPRRTETLARLLADLEEGDALVLYGMFPGEALAVVVEYAPAVEGEFVRVVSLPPPATIRSLVADLKIDPERGPAPGPAAGKLAEAVIAPLALSKGTTRVLASPTDALLHAPFSLLLPPTVAVAYEPSGRILTLLRGDQMAWGHGVLALGDPDYEAAGADGAAPPARGAPRFKPLPNSRAEVEEVARGEKDVRLLGAKATEAGFAAALAKPPEGPRWHAVHFACHGTVDLDRPLYSSLAMTAGDGDDGYLTTLEVMGMRIPADIAVLSACQIGRGPVVHRKGVMGLARAFFAAGTPRVIVSQWDADDAAAKKLTTEFYARWTPEKGAARALREAQESVRTFVAPDGKRPWEAPEFWAGWQLWGLPN
jgi:tetratricopeptide (TPR) repeat protein